MKTSTYYSVPKLAWTLSPCAVQSTSFSHEIFQFATSPSPDRVYLFLRSGCAFGAFQSQNCRSSGFAGCRSESISFRFLRDSQIPGGFYCHSNHGRLDDIPQSYRFATVRLQYNTSPHVAPHPGTSCVAVMSKSQRKSVSDKLSNCCSDRHRDFAGVLPR